MIRGCLPDAGATISAWLVLTHCCITVVDVLALLSRFHYAHFSRVDLKLHDAAHKTRDIAHVGMQNG